MLGHFARFISKVFNQLKLILIILYYKTKIILLVNAMHNDGSILISNLFDDGL